MRGRVQMPTAKLDRENILDCRSSQRTGILGLCLGGVFRKCWMGDTLAYA